MRRFLNIFPTVKQENLVHTYFSANTRVKALVEINFSAL
jgi:hypothetical protein